MTHTSTHLQPQVCLHPISPTALLIGYKKHTWDLQATSPVSNLADLSQTPPPRQEEGGSTCGLLCPVRMVPAGLLAETEGEGADQLGCAADTKSRSVASWGPRNPTPDPSIFRGLYNGPWVQGPRHI